MASEENDAFWLGTKPKAASFSFDDEKCEIINVESIETEKQRAISSPASSYKSNRAAIKPSTILLSSDRITKMCNEETKVLKDDNEITVLGIIPSEAVKKLVLGKPYLLEPFKALYQKKELLNEAISWNDGNAILAVILFLKKTLSQNLFYKIMMDKSVALNHYLKYLKLIRDHSTLNDILVMLGRTEEAFIASYQTVASYEHVETKLNKLRKFSTSRMNNPGLEFIEWNVREQIMLLECQLPIEEEDSKQEKEGKNLIFQTVKRPILLNLSVIDTLHYCCLYHFYLPENKFASPLYFRKSHQLTEKQFVWTALRAFARLELWKDIDALFQSKSWLGNNTTRSVIGFEKVAITLHKANAPMEMITKYLYLVDTSEKRLALAKRFKYHQIVTDTLVSMRDRYALEAYKTELIPNSKEHKYCLESLKASSIKWKN